MDPISSTNFTPSVSPAARVEPPTPPDAYDVQKFEEIYTQQPVKTQVPGDGGWINFQIPQEIPQVSESLFRTAMERLMETHERGSIAIESLFEHIASGADISPAELLKVQIQLGEATTGLSTFQAFDKKTDEGLKALLTGQ